MALTPLYIKKDLSASERSRLLNNSGLTRSDCELLRPLFQKSTLSIDDIATTGASHCVVVSSPVQGGKSSNQGEASANGGEVALNGGVASLPCLRINNSNEGSCEDVKAVGSCAPAVIPSYVRKKEFGLKTNILALFEKHPIGHVGFLTLTYQKDEQCFHSAGDNFNSLATGILNDRFLAWVKVGERTKKGVVHFHLLVVCKQEIRRGFDFDAVNNRDYRSVCPYLRKEWAFWSSRKASPKKPARVGAAERYGFGGRVELKPIRKNAEAVASYLSKYLSKGCSTRQLRDKGVRLISYSKSFPRRCGSRFSFNSPLATAWRQKVAMWAASYDGVFARVAVSGGHQPVDSLTYEDLPSFFGSKWAWRYRDEIMAMEYPF